MISPPSSRWCMLTTVCRHSMGKNRNGPHNVAADWGYAAVSDISAEGQVFPPDVELHAVPAKPACAHPHAAVRGVFLRRIGQVVRAVVYNHLDKRFARGPAGDERQVVPPAWCLK